MQSITLRLILAAICWLFFHGVFAQTSFVRHTHTPLIAYGDTLPLAWAGGLNNPQFSECDLNHDNINDLFVFDRGGNNNLALINSGIANTVQYSISLSALQYFPDTLQNWVLLRDYNCDGAPDIFTSTNSDGIQVYSGAWNSSNQLTFSLAIDKILVNDTTLFVALYDIPAIDDLDYDGDLDILTFAEGGGHVVYYQNRAAETGNACALPQYVKTDPCWGDFYETGITTSLNLDYPCSEGIVPQAPALHHTDATKHNLHPGSTLFTTDLDGNGTTDLVMGDISFDNLVAVYNDGNNVNAHVSVQDTLFPSYNTETHLYIFPAAYEADIDNNGTKDMLVSPNAKAQAQHYNCVWLYKNSQINGTAYDYASDTFLVSDMIDVNRRAAPALFDHNADGLLDIVIGNYGYMDNEQNFRAYLSLYENIGTSTNPVFQLVTKNYAAVNSQFALPRLALKPCFGDLDSDGDADMLIGDNDGYLHYFQNQPIGNIANFVLSGEQYQGLDIGQNAAPQLVDMDGDGLLDLIAGNHNGIIQYRRNNGTASNPIFTTNTNPMLGGVDVRKYPSPTGHATPFFTTINGERILICGSESGLIRVYNNIEGNINTGGIFNELTTANKGITLPDTTRKIREGEFAKPVAADMDNNGRLDILVGLNQGGLIWLEMPDTNAVGIQMPALDATANLHIYPNPSKDRLRIVLPPQSSNATALNLQLYNMQGNLCRQINIAPHLYQANKPIELSIADLPIGLYVLYATNTQNSWVSKVFKTY